MRPAGRQPLAYLLPMLLLMVPLVVGLYRLDRSAWLRRFLFERHQADWERQTDRCNLAGPYVTVTDRMLLGDAFNRKVAGKRVYLFGGCSMEAVLDTRALPVPRSELGIYTLPNCNYEGLDMVTRWLTSDLGLGKALGPDTLVLVGLATDLVEPEPSPRTMDHFIESGLYEVDASGIRLKPMPEPVRCLSLVRQRLAQMLFSFYQARLHRAVLHPPIGQRRDLNTRDLPCQLEALQRILDRMKKTGATVQAVYMPNGSWHETPAWAQVRAESLALCRAEGVPVLDLTGLLKDQDFLNRDDHLAYTGQQKTNRLLAPVVRPYLDGQARYSDCQTNDRRQSG